MSVPGTESMKFCQTSLSASNGISTIQHEILRIFSILTAGAIQTYLRENISDNLQF